MLAIKEREAGTKENSPPTDAVCLNENQGNMEAQDQLYWTVGISTVDRDQGWTSTRSRRVGGSRRLGLHGVFARVELEIGVHRGRTKTLD